MSHVATLSDVTVTPRNIRFIKELPVADTWLGRDPVATALFNALSLTFPDGERMFMDAVRMHKEHLSGKLLEEANAFIAQEAIHTREHVSLNKALDGGHYPLEKIRAHIKDQTQIAYNQGPMTLLVATICLEHFTAMLGDYILRHESFLAGVPEDVRRLWQWHGMEETEHKAVAFDVFNAATKKWSGFARWRARTFGMLYTTYDFIWHITLYAAMLLEADGMPRGKAIRTVLWYIFVKPGLYRKAMKNYMSWFKPGFHPWQHDNSDLLNTWQRHFAVEAAA